MIATKTMSAPFEGGLTYTVRFDGYLHHAAKHLQEESEAWHELLMSLNPDSYRDFALQAVEDSLQLPRYLHGHETSLDGRPKSRTRKALSSGVLDGAQVWIRSFRAQDVMYAGHDSGVLVTAKRNGDHLLILTAYRCGGAGDSTERRLLELKKSVWRRTEKGKHFHRTLHDVRWFTPQTWSARHRRLSA